VVAANPAGTTPALTETQEADVPAGEISCNPGTGTSFPAGSAELDCTVQMVDEVSSYWMVITASSGGTSINLLLTVGSTAVPTGPQFVSPTPSYGSSFSPPNDSFSVKVYDPYGSTVTLTASAPNGLPTGEVICTPLEGAYPPGGYGSDLPTVVGNPDEVQCTVTPQDHSSDEVLFTATSSYGPETLSNSEYYFAGDGSYLPSLDGFYFPNGSPYLSPNPSFSDMEADYPASTGEMLDCTLVLVCEETPEAALFYNAVFLPSLFDNGWCTGFAEASAFLYQDGPSGQPYDTYESLPFTSSQLPFSFEGDGSATVHDMISRYESRLLAQLGGYTAVGDYLAGGAQGNVGVFNDVQAMLQKQGAVVLGIFPSTGVTNPIDYWNLLQRAHTVTAYATTASNGDDQISIYDPDVSEANSSEDDNAAITIDPSGGLTFNDNYPGSTPKFGSGGVWGEPNDWQLVILPDSSWEGSSTVTLPVATNILGSPLSVGETLDNQHWILDLPEVNLTFSTNAAPSTIPSYPLVTPEASGGGPDEMVALTSNSQPLSEQLTTVAPQSSAGVFAGSNFATVTETDSDPVGSTHTMSIDPTATSVTLSNASSAQQFQVELGSDTTSTYGRELVASGVEVDPSDIVSVSTDAATDSVSLTGSAVPQEVQLTLTQVGENGSSVTVTALVPGNGQQAVITVGDWSDLATSAIDETIDGSTTNLNPIPIVVNVTGTQVYGGAPTFTADYSADPAGTAATVSGSLTCSTSATPASTVAGGPYTISSCSGLSSTLGPITYRYGALTVTPAPLTITATPSSPTMTYGGPVPVVTPAYSGLVNGDAAPATPPTCTTTATATSPVAGSPYATSCSGASDPDYTITYDNTATIAVVSRPIVVKVTGTQVYGSTPVYTPSYTGVSWVGTDTPAVVMGKLTCSTSATVSSPVVGNPYSISRCSGLSAANYTIGYSYGKLTVTPAATMVSLTSSADPAVTGQAVTYTATVTSTGGSINPNGEGSMIFRSGSTTLCRGTEIHRLIHHAHRWQWETQRGVISLSGDRATCTVTYPAAGSYPVTASYSGGSDFVASSSSTLTETVKPDSTTTKLTVSSATPLFGQQLTLTATVSANAPGSGVPTGTVDFMDGTVPLGTAMLNHAGKATLTTRGLLPGTHAALTAVYSGDHNYLTSTSSGSRVVVAYTSCISGPHTSPLTVTAGEAICITGTQTGAVTVQPGGALAIVGGRVTGAVKVSGATAFLACGATISGALSVEGVTGPVIIGDVLYDGTACAGNALAGPVSLSDNTGPVALGGSTITGAVSVTGNIGGPIVIEGNRISGPLSCRGNTPPPADDGHSNTVTGARSGQCGASGF
jgi:hypothetical protein